LPLLRVVLPVVVLALLWQLVDGPEVLRLLRDTRPGWVLAALVVASLQIVLSALRWRITAAALEHDMTARHAIGEYYLSQLVNLSLPLGILGDAGRAYRSRHQAGMIRAGQAVMIERMAGQIALFAVMTGGFAALPLVTDDTAMPPWVRQLVLAIGLMMAALAGALLLARHVPGPVSRAAQGFVRASVRALLSRDLWLRQVVLSLAIVACNLATVAFCARATGTALGLAATLTIVPLMLLAMLLPVSAGGWGLREGAAAALWPLVGASAESGVAASIVFGFVILLASLPGIWRLSATVPSPSDPAGRQRPASAQVQPEPSPDQVAD
jgi:uncharacterized membrane protein YbhN (UPF0104 family)